MRTIDCEFAHYQHVFDEADLIKYGSPHFSSKEAGEQLRARILGARHKALTSIRLSFESNQILCANEVFPECAVADPLADLEVWDEWRSGIRAFPYPGKYSRLGLTTQEGKVSSTSSMGVLGEIFAGLFAQEYLSPWVIVRPIRHWPDFIYYTGDGRYSFLEAKAFHGPDKDSKRLSEVPSGLFRDCLTEAVQQLNSDPFVRVCVCFTNVVRVSPISLIVTFVELDAPDRRRQVLDLRVIPQPVVAGLASRAINLGASRVPHDLMEEFAPGRRKARAKRKTAENMLLGAAEESIEEVLFDAGPKALLSSLRESVREEMLRQVKKAKLPEIPQGSRLGTAKVDAAEGRLASVRSLGMADILMADMLLEHRRALIAEWRPDWKRATQPWGSVEGHLMWRCSSALLTVGGSNLHRRDCPIGPD